MRKNTQETIILNEKANCKIPGKLIQKINKKHPGKNYTKHIQPSRKILLAAAIGILLITNSTHIQAAQKNITVGLYENSPKIFTNEQGQPSGIFIEILDTIAKKQDWEITYIPGTWSECLERLKNGTIDLMPDVAFTAERESLFSFPQTPVISSWSQVYAKKESGIETIFDLNNKVVGVLEGSIQYDVFNSMVEGFGLEITLKTAASYEQLFEMAKNGEMEAAIANNYYGLTHAKEMGLEDTTIIFSPASLYFAATSGDPKQLLSDLNKELLELKRNPKSVYYEILNRWTGKAITYTMPPWLKLLLSILGTLILAAIFGSILLQRKVHERTKELREINAEMEQRIHERTAELHAAMERALEADQLKSAFLATMSHELRTPLNSIIGFTGILLQNLAGPLNPEQKKQMLMVQSSARHLLDLINDVLDISKIEAGQLNLEKQRFEVMDSLEKVLGIVTPLANQKKLDLKLVVRNNLGAIMGDRRRFEQILVNLVNNAIKFTDQGSVVVRCEKSEKMIHIQVIDTGIGIPQEERKRLFVPFQQISSGLDRKHEGTGLGLSICLKLLKLMGGSIAVESEPGKGSTFSIQIPIEGQVVLEAIEATPRKVSARLEGTQKSSAEIVAEVNSEAGVDTDPDNQKQQTRTIETREEEI